MIHHRHMRIPTRDRAKHKPSSFTIACRDIADPIFNLKSDGFFATAAFSPTGIFGQIYALIHVTPSNSTSNTNVAFGGIGPTPPSP